MTSPCTCMFKAGSADDSSTMPTRIKLALAILLGLAVLVPGAAIGARGAVAHRWVLYGGRRDGVRIVFELNGHRLAPAFMSIPVACTGGHRPRRLYVVSYSLRHSPIFVNRQGRFHHRESSIDTWDYEFEDFSGRVTSRTIEGKIALSFIQPARIGNEECHSGKHPHGRMEELSFRAYRHRQGR
jgi:hypothetical protein